MTTTQKVLITGGAGYIGSHTLLALKAAGFEPVVVDNFSNSNPATIKTLQQLVGHFSFYELNCCDLAAMQRMMRWEQNICGVIHFAAHKSVAESVQNPLKYYHNNIESLIVLLKIMEEFALEHLVFSSSAAVYGEQQELPVGEGCPLSMASSPYGASKQIAEQMLRDYALANPATKVAMLRYFNPIGAHESGMLGEDPHGQLSNVVPVMLQAAAGLREAITIFGQDYDTPDGTCQRDYIHVMDLAEAHVAAMQTLLSKEEAFCEAINIGTGQATSVRELIEAFELVSSVKVPCQLGERRAGDISAIWADVTKAQELLGWKSTRTAAIALFDAWRWQQHCLQLVPMAQVM